MKTLLAETLLECEELRELSGVLSPERVKELQKRRTDCEQIISYLMNRFKDLNRQVLDVEKPLLTETSSESSESDELQAMDDAAFLRFGAVLRYICTVEVSLQDTPWEEIAIRLRLARAEWRRRF